MGPTEAIIAALNSHTTFGRVLVRALAQAERENEILTMKLSRALDTIARTKPAKPSKRKRPTKEPANDRHDPYR